MIDFYIRGQTLRFYTPVIAADSLNYLSARFHFEGADWNGLTKWAHFRQDETVYDVALDEDNCIQPDCGLNLHLGYWDVYLTGHAEELRITTETAILKVIKSGLIDAPLHAMPQSVAEQISVKADSAFNYAKSVYDAAARGDFMGQSFQVLGYFTTLTELEASVTAPDRGSVYGVGSAAPYDIYIWDSINARWHNNGPIQGAKGDNGESGACYVPGISAAGVLSWSNDKGLDNPEPVSLMGPKGDKGDSGADGMSPYEAAVAEGFTGTATTFNSALVSLPQHAARHAAGAADELPEASVGVSQLTAGAVTRAKLANDAKFSPMLYVAASRAVASGDCGATISFNSGNAIVYSISKSISDTLPNGFEVAILRYNTGTVTVQLSGGIYLVNSAAGTRISNGSAAISERYGMAALKKIDSTTWIITGQVD